MKRRAHSRTTTRPTTSQLRLEHLETREVPALVGGLDPTFGTGGLVKPILGANNFANDVAVDSLGRTVVVGNTSVAGTPGGSDFLVLRFNPDGSPDKTFGTNGKQTVDFAAGSDVANGVAIDANNNVVVVGTTTGATTSMAYARLLGTTGALDTAFGTGGKQTVVAGVGTTVTGNDVALDKAGNIVGIGTRPVDNLPDTSIAVTRLTPDGKVDPSFKTTGGLPFALISSQNGNDNGVGVAVDGNGNIVGAGFRVPAGGGNNQIEAFRLLPDGSLDPVFNGGTTFIKATTVVTGTNERAFEVAVDAANNVYVVGDNVINGVAGTIQKIEVVKFTSGGTVDTSFGTNGAFVSDPGGQNFSFGTDVTVLPSGRLLVGGTTGRSLTDTDFAVLQLLPTGKLDTGFNSTGTTPGVNLIDFGTKAADFVNANQSGGGLAVTPAGRVVVAGADLTAGGVEVARLIGTVEKGTTLAVGGSTDGKAGVFTPAADGSGKFGTTATPVSPFGAGVNVRTATADVNGDGIPDTIAVTGPGTAVRVAVISGKDNKTLLVEPFDPFGDPSFMGGGFVAAGDFDGDGRAEFVVTPDQGGGPRVSIFSLGTDGKTATRANFLGIDDSNFRGGARAAVGDVNGDGIPDLAISAGFGGGPRVALFNGKTVLADGPKTQSDKLVGDFFAFPGTDATNLRNGTFVAIGDITGDGFADLVFGGGPGGAPRVYVLSGKMVSGGDIAGAQNSPVANFFVAGNANDRGGARVAAVDADGDNMADLVVGSGEGSPSKVRAYLGKNVTSPTEPATFQDLDPFGGSALMGGVFVG